MSTSHKNLPIRRLAAAAAIAAGVSAVGLSANDTSADQMLSGINHIVVIYQENHSFDNLYGGWEGVNGPAQAESAHTSQVNEAGAAYTCLKQNDPNLTSPPLPVTCADSSNGIASAFENAPFTIDAFIPPTAATCPNGTPGGTPGGCTRDLVHRFYQEQYQLNDGAQNR